AARAHQFDLILADVMMPNLDGFALLQAIRSDEALSHTPVVFLTARAGEDAAIEGLLAGADDYIAKPFSPRELVARLQAEMERGRADATLRGGEERREVALAAAEMGTWDYDLVANVYRFDARAQVMYGLSGDTLDHRPEGVAAVVHPDDVRPMFDAL